MPVIKVDDQQFSLRPGPNRLGGGAEADVSIADSATGVQAIVEVAGDNQAVIRRAGESAAVRVNGVPLVEPTPLMHGDRLEIAGRELLFAEDSKVGATQHIAASEIAAAAAAKRPGPARATAPTGGRLVSLVDGKEYAVPASGLSIGRDASSGVVVAQNEVSRRHADVVPVDNGYEVRDFSANGVYVNGARVETAQLLSRADVIRVGTEEFRFYADVPPVGGRVGSEAERGRGSLALAAVDGSRRVDSDPSVAALLQDDRRAVIPSAVEGSLSSLSDPSVAALLQDDTHSGHPERSEGSLSSRSDRSVAALLQDDNHSGHPERSEGSLSRLRDPSIAPLPQDAVPDGRPVLAVLEVSNEGPAKGTQYSICVPLAHIGRGAYNDVVIPDDSVSDAHAKLQRRDDGWFLVDVGSTNGTYVAGQRIAAERRLDGAPDLRFGGVKMIFRPRDGSADTNKGTRAIASVDRSKLRPTAAAPAPQITTAPPPANQARPGFPAWVWAVVVLAVGAAAGFFLLNR